MNIQETQVVKDLRAVKTMLDSPSKWTKYTMARSVDGVRCDATDTQAFQWCLTGAIKRSCHEDFERTTACLEEVRRHIPDYSLIVWQDAYQRTFADIHQILDAAIGDAP